MSENRKPISQKLRFEVFKRDSFTCQYCGRKAPEVVLQVDHIKPVASGGTNDITNLVTSCWDCNIGKGKRELSDTAVIAKKQEQLELLNERRNQIQMIAEWEKELLSIEEEQVDLIVSMIEPYGRTFSEAGRVDCKNLIRKCGLQEVIESTKISFAQYYRVGDKESVSKAINYIFRIAETRYKQNKNPYLKDVVYLLKAIKTKFYYLTDYQFNQLKYNIASVFKQLYGTEKYNGLMERFNKILYQAHDKMSFIDMAREQCKEELE